MEDKAVEAIAKILYKKNNVGEWIETMPKIKDIWRFEAQEILQTLTSLGYVKMVEQKQCQYWFPVDGEWKCQK